MLIDDCVSYANFTPIYDVKPEPRPYKIIARADASANRSYVQRVMARIRRR